MTREAFIRKWLANPQKQYNEQCRDEMRDDLDLVIERHCANNTNKQQHMNMPATNKQACKEHRPKQLGYLQWIDYAECQVKKGIVQRECPKCGRWYFPEEYNR